MSPLFDLARMTTATTGTGTITLGSAVTGFLTFNGAGVPTGARVSYGIVDANGNREVGWGIYTSAGTTLTRNSPALISLSGSAQVFITPLAADMITAAPDIAAVPHTYLDFVNNLMWSAPYNPPNPVLCSRASVGYHDDASGVWASFAAGVLRRTNRGARREEARTNGIRNNSGQGAIAGTSGTVPTNTVITPGFAGLTRTISLPAASATSGVDCVDYRFNGTTTGTSLQITFEVGNVIAALTGQFWANSAFFALVGGSLANVSLVQFTLAERTSGAAFIRNARTDTFTPSGTLTRVGGACTLAGGGTTAFVNNTLSFTMVNGAAVDFTIRIGGQQIEQLTDANATYSSLIRTTSAAATRAADVLTLNLPPSFGAGYTLVPQGIPDAPITFASDQYMVSASDGSPTTNRFGVLRLATTGVPNWILNNTKTGIGSTAHAQATSGKVAARYIASDQGGSFNGSGAVTRGSSATVPAGLTVVEIGGDGAGGGAWNGIIESLTIFADAGLDDAVLAPLAGGTRKPGLGHVSQRPRLAQTALVQSFNETIAPGYGVVVPSAYEISSGYTLEIGLGGILEIT